MRQALEESDGALVFRPRPDTTGRRSLDRGEARAAPVFIHSSWRTASTWLWSRLRQAPTAIAYYEFFHERLETCTIENLRDNDFARWNSKHPEGAPYFLEFAPLVGPNGAVRGFDASMAIERFMPVEGVRGDLSLAERSYVEGLIESAAQRQKIPVLTETRTLGRINALAKAFPGRHVLLVRNLFHQWASYSEQCAAGNRFFLEMLFATVEASRRDPFVALLADWFADENRTEASANVFQLFLLFHLYLYARGYDSTDCIVDVTRIAADAEARHAAEASLSEYVRFPIDLSDARSPFGLSFFTVGSKGAFVDAIDQFMKQMADPSISSAAAEFAAEAKDQALDEWERCEFYSGGSRSYFVRSLKLAEQAAEEREAALKQAEAERKRLEQSLERMTHGRDARPAGLTASHLNKILLAAKSHSGQRVCNESSHSRGRPRHTIVRGNDDPAEADGRDRRYANSLAHHENLQRPRH
jgi:hypothetical protein